ncbi:12010_t:CDS:2, partial [Gigaspora rosea]
IFVMSDQYDNIEIQEDKRLKSKSTLVQSISNFCNALIELIAIAVSLIILIGDSLQIFFPNMSLDVLKVIAWVILIPIGLIDLKYLSSFSFLGILTTIVLAIIVIIDGFTRDERPGSLFNPIRLEFFTF